jgi:hypothetical protein
MRAGMKPANEAVRGKMRLDRICFAIACVLASMCGSLSGDASAASQLKPVTIDRSTSLQSILIEQHSDRTRVLVELSLTEYQPVVARLAQMKAHFRTTQRNNTFCIGQRGRFLKSGFLCNSSDFDVMILAKSPSESISLNIADIAEFSEEPLRSALSTVVDTLSEDAINYADTTCARFVFRDSDTNEIRQDIPAIVVVTVDQMQSANEDLQACLR